MSAKHYAYSFCHARSLGEGQRSHDKHLDVIYLLKDTKYEMCTNKTKELASHSQTKRPDKYTERKTSTPFTILGT